jgi:hypothetical protein
LTPAQLRFCPWCLFGELIAATLRKGANNTIEIMKVCMISNDR